MKRIVGVDLVDTFCDLLTIVHEDCVLGLRVDETRKLASSQDRDLGHLRSEDYLIGPNGTPE